MSKPTLSSYSGEPIIVLNPDAKFKFQFGLGKSKLILEHIDAIREFVASGGLNCNPGENVEAEPVNTVAKTVSAKDWLEGKVSA